MNVKHFSLSKYADSTLTVGDLLKERFEDDTIPTNPSNIGKVFISKEDDTTILYNITGVFSETAYYGDLVKLTFETVTIEKNIVFNSHVANYKTITFRKFNSVVEKINTYIATVKSTFQIQTDKMPSCTKHTNNQFFVNLLNYPEDKPIAEIYQEIETQNEEIRELLRHELFKFRSEYIGKTIWLKQASENYWVGLMVTDVFINESTITFEGNSIVLDENEEPQITHVSLINERQQKSHKYFDFFKPDCWALQDSETMLLLNNSFKKELKKI